MIIFTKYRVEKERTTQSNESTFEDIELTATQLLSAPIAEAESLFGVGDEWKANTSNLASLFKVIDKLSIKSFNNLKTAIGDKKFDGTKFSGDKRIIVGELESLLKRVKEVSSSSSSTDAGDFKVGIASLEQDLNKILAK